MSQTYRDELIKELKAAERAHAAAVRKEAELRQRHQEARRKLVEHLEADSSY